MNPPKKGMPTDVPRGGKFDHDPPQRQLHRVMIFALSVIVPAAFAVGIATRKAVPALSVSASGFFPQSSRLQSSL